MKSSIKHFGVMSLVASLVFMLSACGNSSNQTAGDQLDPGNPGKVSPVPPTAPPNSELKICSRLSFASVVWPMALDLEAKRAFALALNVTGSYEGNVGWKSIANSDDGQGLSLGVLNQCLGQSTLQPLFIGMRDHESAYLSSVLNSADHTSFLSMLSRWQSVQQLRSAKLDFGSPLPDGRLSNLDDLPDGSDGVAHPNAGEAESIAWAKKTLYSDGGSTFITRWKSALQKIASHPSYVSYQIDAAQTYHAHAVNYMHALGLTQMRSYLMLFDVIVQLGAFYSSDIATYLNTYPLSAKVDEATRLKKLLSLRVAHVAAKYKKDVTARKLTIINGTGAVHGTARDLPKEYCFTSTEALSL